MRSVGDMRWINDYVGLPYAFGGRDRSGIDCYGLIRLVYQERYRIPLPDWAVEKDDMLTRERMISGQVGSGNWKPLDEPLDGCFVLCYRHKAAYHMGLYYGGGVLHAVDGFSSMYEPMQRFRAKYNKIAFGEWTP